MFSPTQWCASVGIVAAATVIAAGLLSAPWWVLASLAAVGAVGLLSLHAWHRARRSDGRGVVFIARFDNENPEYGSIATVHLKEIERRLANNEVLRKTFDLRFLNAPLKESHAQRLLAHTEVVTVISGSGLLVDGHARWDGWVLQRWPQVSGVTIPNERGDGFIGFVETHLSAIQRATTRTDAEYPVRKLTADLFSAEHADDIEGVLLVAAAAFAQNEPDELAALGAAEAMRGQLPPEAAAVFEIGNAMRALRETGDAAAAARALEAAGDAGANHIYLWNSCLVLWTRAEQQNTSNGEDRVRVANKGLAVAPGDFFAQTGLAYGYMAQDRPEEGVPHLEEAMANPERLDEQLLRQDLTEAYRQAGDLEKAREEARREYALWPPSMRRTILKANRMTEKEYLSDPLAGRDDEPGTGANLTDSEADAVARAVRAVVHNDREELERLGALADSRDPYAWVHEDPLGDGRCLVIPWPEDDPREWELQLRRRPDGTTAVDVWLPWTDGEVSPYALQLDLKPGTPPRAVFIELQPL